MLTSILLDKEGLQREVLQRTSTALSTDWHLLVLQGSLKVWWQECQPFPTATDSNSITLGHPICDPLLLSFTWQAIESSRDVKESVCPLIWGQLSSSGQIQENGWHGVPFVSRKTEGVAARQENNEQLHTVPLPPPARHPPLGATQPILNELPVNIFQQGGSTVKGTHRVSHNSLEHLGFDFLAVSVCWVTLAAMAREKCKAAETLERNSRQQIMLGCAVRVCLAYDLHWTLS